MRDMYRPESHPSLRLTSYWYPLSRTGPQIPFSRLVETRSTPSVLVRPLLTKFWILQTAPESPCTRNITHVTSAINDESSKGPEMIRSLRYHYKVLAMGKFRCWGWHGQTIKLGCSMNRKVVVGEMTKKGQRYISFRYRQNRKGVYWPCISAIV